MMMRWTQCQELAFFYLAILLLVTGSSGASAQLMDAQDRLFVNDSNDDNPADNPAITNGDGDDAVDVMVQNWRGFATKDNESHPIRLNVETIRTVGPAEARRLLASNMSLEKVRSQMRAGDRDVIRRGNIRLNNNSCHDCYWLTNIILMPLGNRSTLEARVASPRSRSGSGDAASIVGHTVLTISVVDDIEVAKGYLVIDDSKYSGTYSLLLNECSGRCSRASLRPGG